MQLAIDLCLIILFVVFIRQVRTVGKSSKVEQMTGNVEQVLKEAKGIAGRFETQLEKKREIVNKLNEHLDSRIVSLNLLLNRAEECLASAKGNKFHTDVDLLQQEIIALAEGGSTCDEISNRLGISKGEVALVLDLQKKSLETEKVSTVG